VGEEEEQEGAESKEEDYARLEAAENGGRGSAAGPGSAVTYSNASGILINAPALGGGAGGAGGSGSGAGTGVHTRFELASEAGACTRPLVGST
jgi:hypothetical protein